MEIEKIKEGSTLILKINGAINTLTAPEIEKNVFPFYNSISKIVVDLKDVNYMSSAGLRVLTSININMTKQGGVFEIVNIPDVVNEVFELTNFYELLGITRK